MMAHEVSVISPKAAPAQAAPAGIRLFSLDLLRGVTIAFMILVNNNGDEEHAFSALRHARWNGFTATDLVFPTFLFLAGASLVFSTESRLARGSSRAAIAFHALRRAVILFLLGLVVNGFPAFHWETLRIYGVLQRIAICYLLGSILYLLSRRASLQIAFFAGSLAAYWILMHWVPVPGYGVPGRDIPLLDPNANLVAFLDRHIFPGRLYEGVRDPEGMLSTLPAMGTLLLGVITAQWLRCARSLREKLIGLVAAGATALAAGGVWDLWFPINKKLWTSSYVLWAGGWSLLILAFCFWLVEIRRVRRGLWPWLAFGTNAISAYVFAELLQSTWAALSVRGHLSVERWLYLNMLALAPWPAFASLIYSVCFVAVCFIPIAILYRRHVFIKI